MNRQLFAAHSIGFAFGLGCIFTISIGALYCVLAGCKRKRWPKPQDKPYLVE